MLRYVIRQTLFIVSLFLGFTSGSYAQDELLFATAPTHSKQITKETYTPILNHLSKALGRDIKLHLPINFLDYSNKMRNDKYDIVFDGPHFVGWRMANLEHTPVVKLPGTIKIVIATKQQNAQLKNIDDLVGQRVCAFSPPNLLTLGFLSLFENPLRLPVITPAKGFKGLIQCLQTEKGQAAVFRDKMWEKMDKTGLRLVASPERGYPERTFSVSSRIDAGTQQKIKAALLSDDGQKSAQKLLTIFKKQNLVEAIPNQYDGLDKLLYSTWGFRK